jgi:hypothetical protein
MSDDSAINLQPYEKRRLAAISAIVDSAVEVKQEMEGATLTKGNARRLPSFGRTTQS